MEREAIQTENYKGYEINIYPDYYCESPREWDNLGTIFYACRNYSIGEKDLTKLYPEASNWNEVCKLLLKDYNPCVILPVFMYDHSIQRFKVGSFQGLLPQGHAEFDSGQIGFILVEKKKVREEYSCKRISKKLKTRIENCLRSEIETLDEWSSGQVYGYDIPDLDSSCYGFIGDMQYCIDEAKSIINHTVEYNRKKKQGKLKDLIKNKVNLIKRQEILQCQI